MNKIATLESGMYGTQMLSEDEIQQALAGLRQTHDALSRLGQRAPGDSPLQAQTRHVLAAINGMAETLSGDPEYFWSPSRS